jgi:Protein of unknown function DUF115.
MKNFSIYTIESFVSRFCNTAISFIKILFSSKFKSDIFRIKTKKKTCYILGNGPSLSKDLIDNSDRLKLSELVVVNFFAKSDIYQQLKPRFYLLADSGFYSDNNAEYVQKNIELFNDINTKTTWEIFLLIPYKGVKYITPYLCSNSNIHIIGYNNVSSKNTFFWFDKIVHDKQLAIFSGMNVVSVASYIAIIIGFKEINLLGVDHSWFKNYNIGDDNSIYINEEHFYENTKENIIPVVAINPKTNKIYKLHELLMCEVVTFETYHMIEKYAQYKNVKIYNRCSYSYIDAFERK